jgi:signal transduction histidine kinase/DNA-binding response OmpR family regulator
MSRDRDVSVGGGRLDELVRSFDWAKTPLGPAEAWPESLRTSVSTCLASRFPILLWWGPELVKIYNDAYAALLGAKHPGALGRPGREVWPEIWDIIGPMLTGVLERGEATWSEDQMLPLERNGFVEECYFTFSYSPIGGESRGVDGVFTAVTETTGKVIGERRLAVLRDLASRTALAKSQRDASAHAIRSLAASPADAPFALVYLLDEDKTTARVVASTGLEGHPEATRDVVFSSTAESPWGLERALSAAKGHVVDDVERRFGSLPGGPWPEPSKRAMVLPLTRPGLAGPFGFLVAGVSPRLPFDERYRGFLEVLAEHVGLGIGSARAYEEEKQRAEALAEIDRAKTVFFSNISHEFRTPLTLMLGPTEDALRSKERVLGGADLELLHRNELRLLRLVNTLLDFARAEAGRAHATYEPTDLAALTRDLASAFRSAMARGGLSLEVECDAPVIVHVDRGMWEKIVSNLLSNAFKFTFEGSVTVRLFEASDRAILEVSDTGVGIAEADLGRVFERFHRIEGKRGRTHEGSGIGLALVQDLVRLHGGEIRVASAVSRGTTFTVSLPLGSAHLPAHCITSPSDAAGIASRVEPYVAEALRWLPDSDGAAARSSAHALDAALRETGERARILVVDDNADMRDYLRRLLERRWAVATARTGREALEAVEREAPALVLTDVMMPEEGGFELLARLRADPTTRHLPVVLVSARAGEEATAAALRMGADDYIVKPFSASELLVRVEAQLAAARARREARAAADAERRRLYSMLVTGPAAVCLLTGDDLIIDFANPALLDIWGKTDEIVGKPLLEAIPELEGQGFDVLLRRVMATGAPHHGEEKLAREKNGQGELEHVYFDFLSAPVREADGRVTGAFVCAFDVTAKVKARRAAEIARAEAERARAEAEAANRMKDDFLATMSHELRTPLNAILGWAEILRSGVTDEKTTARALETIERNAKAQARLIEDVLEISRITSGNLRLDRKDVDVAAVLSVAADAIRPQAMAKGVKLRLLIDKNTGTILADPDRLQQIVWNLISNAVKFTLDGGSVEVLASRAGDVQRITVRDTGIGIPKDQLGRIFERFSQVDGSTTRRHGGLGLGLAIARHVTELHGGTITASSGGAGFGSEFTVSLPVRPLQTPLRPLAERRATDNSAPNRTDEVLARVRVLVVDDDEDSRLVTAVALERAGAIVMTANTSAAALEVIERSRPDLVISDIGMPDEDGYTLIRKVRQLEPARGGRTPAIALTAYARREDREHALAAGYQQHLVKPVDPLRLVEVARAVAPQRP